MFGFSHVFHWVKSGGSPIRARVSRWRNLARRIVAGSDRLQSVGDDELLLKSRDLQWRAKTGVPLKWLMPEAYMLVREASRRTLGMTHYPVQIMGGIGLFEGGMIEMQTGEGKTLTALLPAYLRALPGYGCHVVTVNDYLARRDAEEMGPVYNALGLTVGCIETTSAPFERKKAYDKDITYGTAKEIGFDFLRDRLKLGAKGGQKDYGDLFGIETKEQDALVQRGHYFALIDEADSILIDEARTPLIIGIAQDQTPATLSLYNWAEQVTKLLEPTKDYVYEPKYRTAYLTDFGCRRLLMVEKPRLLDSFDTERINKHVEQALTARFGFQLNRDYIVNEDKIVIVDESTGRMMDGRTWQDGLHQAVEAKEGIPITEITGQAARVTVQTFFRQFAYLSGMTGTAMQSRKEFRRAYNIRVAPIPTHRKCLRKGKPPRIFKTLRQKQHAVADEVERLIQQGCAVLVGTPSVAASETLGDLLKERGIQAPIINAKYHEQEAAIVSEAGHEGRVTIATNMAGRGTDIKLTEKSRAAGGLHVIATEMHTSIRIDRQLVGRAARQGDPGIYQFFLSLEDELLRVLEPEDLQAKQKKARANAQGEISSSWIRFFRRVQRRLEREHYKQRKDLCRQEQHQMQQHLLMGLDPYLELTE
ncbi:MAG: translocase [Planctomycetaceae bacterium]